MVWLAAGWVSGRVIEILSSELSGLLTRNRLGFKFGFGCLPTLGDEVVTSFPANQRDGL